MNTIYEQWESFRASVISSDAPAVQVREMRRAFYCGVEGMLRIQWSLAGENEDAAVMMLEGIHDEVRRFARELGKGNA